ncbi:MAG: hypothetical protein CM1200mP10_27620 [Candidatus Neomarinimicrobiota bacterium]|nr:MAG: hypothetical protein CM1200mP10_27620 [Candidatus Neomarinimicrobiota bacterium]
MDSDFSGNTISAFPKYTWNFLADFRLPSENNIMFVSQLQADFIDEKQSQLSSSDEFNQLRDDARTLVEHALVSKLVHGAYLPGCKKIYGCGIYQLDRSKRVYWRVEQDYGLPRRFGLELLTAFKLKLHYLSGD